MSELRELLAKSGLTRLVADEMPPDCKEFEPGWRIHDMPENSSWAQFLAEGLEKGEADLIVAAVNNLPALLDKIEQLEEAVKAAALALREAANVLRKDFPSFASLIDANAERTRAALRSRQSTGERE